MLYVYDFIVLILFVLSGLRNYIITIYLFSPFVFIQMPRKVQFGFCTLSRFGDVTRGFYPDNQHDLHRLFPILESGTRIYTYYRLVKQGCGILHLGLFWISQISTHHVQVYRLTKYFRLLGCSRFVTALSGFSAQWVVSSYCSGDLVLGHAR